MNRLNTSSLRNVIFSRGSTLVEVIVAVILLTLGVLALMATQLRAVTGISEAETRTIISQSAESLADSMLMNPELESASSANGDTYNRSYLKHYLTSAKKITQSAGGFSPNSNGNSKSELANIYKNQFETELYNKLIAPESSNIQTISYTICADKSKPDNPTLDTSGTMDGKCSGNDITAIKIAWRVKTANGTNKNGDSTDYSYILKVAD